jgi:hypothetical protein
MLWFRRHLIVVWRESKPESLAARMNAGLQHAEVESITLISLGKRRGQNIIHELLEHAMAESLDKDAGKTIVYNVDWYDPLNSI